MELNDAQGSIGPDEYSNDLRLQEEVCGGLWCTTTSWDVPTLCIDGRPPDDPRTIPQAPRSAGGTIGLWIAQLLSEDPGTPIPPLSELADKFASANLPVGVHTGPAHGEHSSGCGAADGLDTVLEVLRKKQQSVRALIEEWGFVPDALDDQMLVRAMEIADQHFWGDTLVATIAERTEAAVLALQGEHHESIAVINQRPHTTLGYRDMQPAPQFFWIDAWAFTGVAKFLCSDHCERTATALAAFNAAALLALACPGFPLVEVANDRA